MKTLEEEIAQAEQNLAKLQQQKAKQDRLEKQLTQAQKIAIQLHSLLCRWNHTDGCDWDYRDLADPNTWTAQYGPHAKYLEKAEQALKMADPDTIINLTKILKGN